MSRIILKYFTGVEKIVVIERGLTSGTLEEAKLQLGAAKAIQILCSLRKLKEIVFLDEVGLVHGFQKLVDKVLEGERGVDEKKVVFRIAEKKIPQNAGYELAHWSL